MPHNDTRRRQIAAELTELSDRRQIAAKLYAEALEYQRRVSRVYLLSLSMGPGALAQALAAQVLAEDMLERAGGAITAIEREAEDYQRELDDLDAERMTV